MGEGNGREVPRWGAMAIDRVAAAQAVEPTVGLSADEVGRRRAIHGPNVLPHGHPQTWWQTLARQFANTVVLLLVAAALVSLALGERADALAIAAVLALNAAVGFAMERRAERDIAALAALTADRARVRRAGHIEDIPAADVVPGDVVLLEPGDRVPADGRLLVCWLRVDESLLSGEAIPVEKRPEPPSPPAEALGDRRNELFAGTVVAAGAASMIVTGTGRTTEIGRIGRLVADAPRIEAPITGRLELLGRQLVALVAGVAVLILAIGMAQARPFGELLEVAVVLAIAAIPEGMPAVATLALAAGARRLARGGLLLRRLAALEALGAVTTLAIDKTGTLTENALTVQAIRTDARAIEVTGTGWEPTGAFLADGAPLAPADAPDLRALLGAVQLCNDATLERHGAGWHVHGDPSEGALLVAAAKAGLADPRPASPRLAVLAPQPDRPWMLVVCRRGARDVALIKGAADQLLARCETRLTAGGVAPLDAAARARWLAEEQALAARALRVFAVAERPLAPGWTAADLETGWSWLGLAGMADPPRADAAQALEAARRAGLRVVMLTGDQPRTAVAIAQALGMDPSDVVARVSPEGKLALVRALEDRGEVVAMTGDGVNDAPALRTATVGVAMGGGAEVAREAAAAVLVDQRLATLVAAVGEGRAALANIGRALDYLLTCSITTMLVVLLTVVAGFPLPLAPLQILYLNLLTHSFPALGLALEPTRAGDPPARAMPRAAALVPGGRLASILWHGLSMAVVTLGVGAWGLAHADPVHARTLVFAALATALLTHALSDRDPRPFGGLRRPMSLPFLAFLGAALALQGLAIYAPFLAALMDLTALEADDWLAVLGAGGVSYVAVELSKHLLPPEAEPAPTPR